MMRFFWLIPAFILLITAGCSEQKPEKLVDEDTYKRMFVEFAIINQLDSTVLKNRTHADLRDLVYEHYGVTSEQFRVSHEYYETDLDAQIQRVNAINQLLQRERDKISEAETEYRNTQQTPVDTLRQRILNR